MVAVTATPIDEPRSRRDGRRRAGSQLCWAWCVCMWMCVTSLILGQANALGLGDVPPNSDERMLVRFTFPRLYSMTAQEIKQAGRGDTSVLAKDPYGLLGFQSVGVRDADVKRIVIMMHGQGRDGWLYQDQATEAFNVALNNVTGYSDAMRRDLAYVRKNETLIISPQFLNEQDNELAQRTNELQFDANDTLTMSQAAPAETMLQWQGNTWALGGDSIAPSLISRGGSDSSPVKAPPMSSFEVMDALIARMVDGQTYPQLQTIVVAGHSLGAQFVHRYALIGAVPSRHIAVHFFIGNPGSFAYLTPERALSTAGCPDTYDVWKYGLSVFGIRYLYDMVKQSLDSASDLTDVRVRYLRDRRVHYLFGMNDTVGQGDQSCEAQTQGRFHLERGQNYMAHVNKTADQLSVRHDHTIDYLPGVQHDALAVFTTNPGIQRLFLSNADGTETARGVGYADADFSRYPYRFSAASTLAPAARWSVLWAVVSCIAASLSISLLL